MCVEQSNIEKGLDQWINSVLHIRGGLVAQKTENLPAMGRPSFIPRLGRSPGGGHGNPLQHSCLEKSMGRGAW